MGGEAVAQGMRRSATGQTKAGAPYAQAAAHVARAQRTTGLAEEQRLLISAGRIEQARAAGIQIEPQGRRGLLPGRQVARLASLALHAQLLAVVVDVAEPQRYELLGAQAAGIGELEERAIALLQEGGR